MNSNNEYAVSVLMTAYNRENLVGESIESVLSSTFLDFELVIVDDCSNDSTFEVAKSYELVDGRVKVFRNDENLGDYPNRNKAASYAQGKYLKYLDSDDIMHPKCLERLVFEMENNPDCAFAITSRSENVVHFHDVKDSYRVHFFSRGILDVGPSAVIIRRDVFFKENGFLELRCVSDFEFWMRLALIYPILECEKDLIIWRRHDQQEINLGSHAYLEFTFSIIKNKLCVCPFLSDNEKKIIETRYKRTTMRYLIKFLLKLGITNFVKFKKVNGLRFTDAI